MNQDFKILSEKIRKMFKYIKEEYDNIMDVYKENNIIHKAIPLKPSNKAKPEQINYINSILEKFFTPTLEIISKMIDAGVIEWAEATEEIKLEEIISKDKNIEDLIYESWDKLYIYKHIRYDLTFDFIMQSYLFLEKEITNFLNKNSNGQFTSNSLFLAIRYIEKELNKKVDDEIKEKLDMYRNIINVYKHGNGSSFKNILNCHSEILNFTNIKSDFSFVFNLEKISLNDFYNCALDFTFIIES